MSLDVDSAVLSSVAYAIGDDTHTESVPSAPRSSDDTSEAPLQTSVSSAEGNKRVNQISGVHARSGRGHGRFGQKNRRGPPKSAASRESNYENTENQQIEQNHQQQPNKPLKNKSRDQNPSDDRNGKDMKSRSRGSRGRGRGRGPPPNKPADNI